LVQVLFSFTNVVILTKIRLSSLLNNDAYHLTQIFLGIGYLLDKQAS
jgi:hypothetical protein